MNGRAGIVPPRGNATGQIPANRGNGNMPQDRRFNQQQGNQRSANRANGQAANNSLQDSSAPTENVNTPDATTNNAINPGMQRQPLTPRRNVIPNNGRSTTSQQAARQRAVSGTISNLNGDTFTFSGPSGTSQYTLSSETQVLVNGQNSTLADLPPNATVRLFTDPNNPMTVQKIVATTGAQSGGVDGQATGETPVGQAPTTSAGSDLTVDGQGAGANANGSVTQEQGLGDPRRPIADRPFASTPAGASQQQQQQAQPSRSNGEGFGNDIAGRINPDGSVTYYQGRQANGEQSPTSGGTTAPPADGSNPAAGNSRQTAPGNQRSAAGNNSGRVANSGPRVTRETFKGPPVDLGWQLRGSGDGVTINNVTASGIAAQALLQNGDVITSINGHAVSSPSDVSFELHRLAPNTTAEFGIRRNGETVTQRVTLPKTHHPLIPRSAQEIAEENRALEAQLKATRDPQN